MPEPNKKAISRLRVYTIQIDNTFLPTWMKNIWYASREGEVYTAILISKEMEHSFLPRFLILENDNLIKMPTVFLTVRPEEAVVIGQRIEIVPQTFSKTLYNICKPGKEDVRYDTEKRCVSKGTGEA